MNWRHQCSTKRISDDGASAKLFHTSAENRAQGHLPRVLAVLVSHNSADYVASALRSLIRQEYPRLRKVVIDNASTDGTLNVVNHFADCLEIVANKENVGFSAALNQAIEMARDEEFFFIHQDDVDLMENDYIGRAMEHFADIRVAAVTGKMMAVTDSRLKRLLAGYLRLDEEEGSEVHEGSWPHLKADLFRLATLRKIGGFSYAGNYRLGAEDQIMGLKLRQANGFVLRDPSLMYRVDFARCDGFGRFLRKEWDTGRSLGLAIGRHVVAANPSKSRVDRARRNHRIEQVGFTLLLLAVAAAAVAGLCGTDVVAALIGGRGLWLAYNGRRLGPCEAFLFSALSIAGDVAFSLPFALTLGASWASGVIRRLPLNLVSPHSDHQH